ncbi:MAG: tetratricopeptide repeat protein [Candidatus Accumulibacter phosphatis]|uniref:tetratricopeptide repeat protein n=1 Tax=Candidatus Accumulibacter phosphatis TaxID=327160 RepID=UPI001A5C198B|nr:tetratricopeptide repeat protein [Candidatus Accumulibacter phosphatis]
MIDALFELLGTLYQKGDFAQAERVANGIQQTIPGDVVSLQFLGLLCYRSGRRADALRAFIAAAGNDADSPGPPGVANSLHASTHCLRAARTQGSALASAWYDMGLILFRLRRYQQAITALQEVTRALPNDRAAQRAIVRIARFSRRRTTPTASHQFRCLPSSLAQPLRPPAQLHQSA